MNNNNPGEFHPGVLQPENLAHHGTASSLNYKDWDANDVACWLDEHLKLPQYKEVFGKKWYSEFLQAVWGSMGHFLITSETKTSRQTSTLE